MSRSDVRESVVTEVQIRWDSYATLVRDMVIPEWTRAKEDEGVWILMTEGLSEAEAILLGTGAARVPQCRWN